MPSDVPHGLALAAEAVRKAKRVVVISGAGISTHAIPDFRSSSGLFKEIAAQAKAEAKAGGKGSKVRRRKGGQLEDESSGRSTPVADMSGIKSGKDLFDVKCFTVSPSAYISILEILADVLGSAPTCSPIITTSSTDSPSFPIPRNLPPFIAYSRRSTMTVASCVVTRKILMDWKVKLD